MSDHDPLCRMATGASEVFCDCTLIRAVEERESRRIVIGITDLPDALTGEQDSRAIPTAVDTESVFKVIGHGWERR